MRVSYGVYFEFLTWSTSFMCHCPQIIVHRSLSTSHCSQGSTYHIVPMGWANKIASQASGFFFSKFCPKLYPICFKKCLIFQGSQVKKMLILCCALYIFQSCLAMLWYYSTHYWWRHPWTCIEWVLAGMVWTQLLTTQPRETWDHPRWLAMTLCIPCRYA